jgi:hypothetical protein
VEPIRGYEREHPVELIHLDFKKLGRIGSVNAAWLELLSGHSCFGC